MSFIIKILQQTLQTNVVAHYLLQDINQDKIYITRHHLKQHPNMILDKNIDSSIFSKSFKEI